MTSRTRLACNTEFGGWLWESPAEVIATQYPGTNDRVGCSARSAWMPHLYFGSTRVRDCNGQFWAFLRDPYGFGVVNDIFLRSAGQTGQDPFAVLMRNQGWTVAQRGDEFGRFAMCNVTWDYTDWTFRCGRAIAVCTGSWWRHRTCTTASSGTRRTTRLTATPTRSS